MSCGHLCVAEAPTEAAAETYPPVDLCKIKREAERLPYIYFLFSLNFAVFFFKILYALAN